MFIMCNIVQFKHSPTNIHWSAIKRILPYLYGTLSFDLNLTRKCDLSLLMDLVILIGFGVLKTENLLIVLLLFFLSKLDFMKI